MRLYLKIFYLRETKGESGHELGGRGEGESNSSLPQVFPPQTILHSAPRTIFPKCEFGRVLFLLKPLEDLHGPRVESVS